MEKMQKEYNYVCDQDAQRKRHRDVSKQSPFMNQDIPCKEILLDSVQFSITRNPTKTSPRDYPASKVTSSPAGFVSNFGKKLLEFQGGNPGDLARKAKQITSIQLGNPDLKD